MALYYWRCANFGDQLNEWLWKSLLGEVCESEEYLLVGIGTILSVDVPYHERRLVFGSGAGYKAPPQVDETWEFFAVRGPRTCKALGLQPRLGIGDGATLVRCIDLPDVESTEGKLFIPHHISAEQWDWQEFCEGEQLEYVAPSDDPLSVISRIRQARVVYTEAMHGAILADAFRVPWVPLRIYPHINSVKWMDWLDAMELSYKPCDLRAIFAHSYNYPLGRVGRRLPKSIDQIGKKAFNAVSKKVIHKTNSRILAKTTPILSSDRKVEEVTERLYEQFAHLKQRVEEIVA